MTLCWLRLGSDRFSANTDLGGSPTVKVVQPIQHGAGGCPVSAECLMRHLAPQIRPDERCSQHRVEVFSAGSQPSTIHPLAIKAMQALDIDLSQQRSKHLNEFAGQAFDYVITVCDRVRESCPVFPGDPEHIHWSFPDPVAVEGPMQARELAFRETATQLITRINFLLLMIDRSNQEARG